MAPGSAVCLRFSSAARLSVAGLSRKARLALCGETQTPPHFNSTPGAVDDPGGALGNAELAGNFYNMAAILSRLYVSLIERKYLHFCL